MLFGNEEGCDIRVQKSFSRKIVFNEADTKVSFGGIPYCALGAEYPPPLNFDFFLLVFMLILG